MYKQREKIIVLFSLLLLLGGVIPGQAQKTIVSRSVRTWISLTLW